MIKYVKGDILTPNADTERAVIVCYQVNFIDLGLAKQVRGKFPEVYELYKKMRNLRKSESRLRPALFLH